MMRASEEKKRNEEYAVEEWLRMRIVGRTIFLRHRYTKEEVVFDRLYVPLIDFFVSEPSALPVVSKYEVVKVSDRLYMSFDGRSLCMHPNHEYGGGFIVKDAHWNPWPKILKILREHMT